MLQAEKYKKRITTDVRKYQVAWWGEFVFDPMSLYYGAIGRQGAADRGLISPDYVAFQVDDTVDPVFLDYLLRWPRQHAIYEANSETGNQFGKRRRLYWSVLETLSFDLPPLVEQRKIAAILSVLDDVIEKTEAVIAQLHVVKRAMMQEVFTRGLAGRHTRFRMTEIGRVPEEWDVVPVGEAGAVDAGKARDPRASGVPRPYLRVANVFDGEIRIHDVLSMPFTDREFERFEIKPGDVLLNEGQSLELVGRCALYRGELGQPCAMQNALLRFRSSGRVLPAFAEQYFRWCQQMGRFAEIATQTTSIAHLGLKRFSSMLMAVPPAAEQDAIVAVLAALDSRLIAERRVKRAQDDLKRALAAALLSGEVRVTLDQEVAA